MTSVSCLGWGHSPGRLLAHRQATPCGPVLGEPGATRSVYENAAPVDRAARPVSDADRPVSACSRRTPCWIRCGLTIPSACAVAQWLGRAARRRLAATHGKRTSSARRTRRSRCSSMRSSRCRSAALAQGRSTCGRWSEGEDDLCIKCCRGGFECSIASMLGGRERCCSPAMHVGPQPATVHSTRALGQPLSCRRSLGFGALELSCRRG